MGLGGVESCVGEAMTHERQLHSVSPGAITQRPSGPAMRPQLQEPIGPYVSHLYWCNQEPQIRHSVNRSPDARSHPPTRASQVPSSHHPPPPPCAT